MYCSESVKCVALDFIPNIMVVRRAFAGSIKQILLQQSRL